MDKEFAIRVLEELGHNVGEVKIKSFYEDGFIYERTTEYMKCTGIAEYIGSNSDMMKSQISVYTWNLAEVVIERYK